MGLALLGIFVISLTWLVNETLDGPIRVFALIAIGVMWILLWLPFLRPTLVSAYRSAKKKLKGDA